MYMRAVKSWFKRTLWFHKWKYRNPYSKRCVICGKQEQKYYYDLRHVNIPGKGWWEIHDLGDETKHYK